MFQVREGGLITPYFLSKPQSCVSIVLLFKWQEFFWLRECTLLRKAGSLLGWGLTGVVFNGCGFLNAVGGMLVLAGSLEFFHLRASYTVGCM